MPWSPPMPEVGMLFARSLARAGRGLAIGSALALVVARGGDAAAAEPSGEGEDPPPTEAPGDPGPDEAPEATPPSDPPAEADPALGAGAEPPADPGVAAGEPSVAGEATAGGTTPAGAAASPAPSTKGLPSGHAKTDDVPVDEAQRAEDRRAGRRRLRDRERDEGHWQVFAPYPELGPIRYRDPEDRRTLWLGLDASGTYLPSTFGLADQAVWAVRPAGAWAFALMPWLALGGRHEVEWYDTDARRIRVHGHQVELSSRPLAASRSADAIDDRLALGLTTHAIRWTEDDATSDGTGPSDTILHLGYGLDHLLGARWRLGWHAQARHAWIPRDTQRQVRLSARVAFNPRPAHRLSLDAVGYYVNRDDPAGDDPLPRHSVHGQLGLGYAWVGRAGVGPWTNVRATSHFRSGEAPVYELREEALDGAFGEVLVGMMARWP